MRPSLQAWSVSKQTAKKYCESLVREKDRSSYILNGYIPKQGQDVYLALRAFNIEIAKICDSFTQPAIAQVKMEFWKDAIQRIFSSASSASSKEATSEPVSLLLSCSLRENPNIALSKRYLMTMVQSRETVFLNKNVTFRNLDAMASYGEGVHSQLNYLTLELMYSLSPKTSEFMSIHPDVQEHVNNILAHVGQAAGITSLLRALTFYAKKRDFVPLPVDIMAKHDISHEEILQGIQANQVSDELSHKLSEVVFETATRANDHILSASSLLQTMKSELGSIPDAVTVPALGGVPSKLYLERLEKSNFDILKPTGNEWRLPWRSYRFYKTQTF